MSNMRIIITGAATGIGAEFVHLAKAEGHHVTAFDIAQTNDVDHWVNVDLADTEAINQACEQLVGPFDVLINNAGLPPREGNQEKVLAVNVFGLRTMLRAMLPKLVDGARIVNTASRAGMHWKDNIEEVKTLLSLEGPNSLEAFLSERNMDSTRAYNLSKEAVIVYTKSLTELLLARNIRINSVSPAPIETNILDDFKSALGDRVDTALAMAGRAGSAEEVARVILFLASEQSNWIKGHDLLVDGGFSAMVITNELQLDTTV